MRPAKRRKEMGGDFWKGIARKAAEARGPGSPEGSRGTGGTENVRREIAGGGGERTWVKQGEGRGESGSGRGTGKGGYAEGRARGFDFCVPEGERAPTLRFFGE